MTADNHRCQRWQRQLDDFVDDRLAPKRRAELLRHLDGCASCRRQVEEIEALLAAARELPRTLPPPRDGWPAIESRLTPRRHRPQLRVFVAQAIAAALLVAFGGVASQLLWPPAADTRTAESRFADTATIEVARAEAEYLRVKETLWISILRHRDELSPMTVSVVEHNLRTIDRAIEEIHQALEQDPGNSHLEGQLFANHRRGIGLLRRLATATATDEI